MADRDLQDFGHFVSLEAVVQWWSRYFQDGAAPLSWEPDQVEVLASGTLAPGTGPIRDAQGRLMGRFASIWRQERSGQWRIVFDRSEAAPANQGGVKAAGDSCESVLACLPWPA
jgi:ketosteroid isomerase-like protein